MCCLRPSRRKRWTSSKSTHDTSSQGQRRQHKKPPYSTASGPTHRYSQTSSVTLSFACSSPAATDSQMVLLLRLLTLYPVPSDHGILWARQRSWISEFGTRGQVGKAGAEFQAERNAGAPSTTTDISVVRGSSRCVPAPSDDLLAVSALCSQHRFSRPTR